MLRPQVPSDLLRVPCLVVSWVVKADREGPHRTVLTRQCGDNAGIDAPGQEYAERDVADELTRHSFRQQRTDIAPARGIRLLGMEVAVFPRRVRSRGNPGKSGQLLVASLVKRIRAAVSQVLQQPPLGRVPIDPFEGPQRPDLAGEC